MTTIQIKADKHIEGRSRVFVNGRDVCDARHFSSINQVSEGSWNVVTRNGVVVSLVGGRKAGGQSNDWFVKEEGCDTVKVNSAVEAIKLVAQY